MSEIMILVDVQEAWVKSNPVIKEHIQKATDMIRAENRMPLLWVVTDWADVPYPVQVKYLGLDKIFNFEAAARPALRMHPNDWIVSKNEMSLFRGTAFNEFLKQQGITKIYLAGFDAALCVLQLGKDARRQPERYEVVALSDLMNAGGYDYPLDNQQATEFKRENILVQSFEESFLLT